MNKNVLNKKFKELKMDAIISQAPQTRLWYSEIQTTDGYIIIEPNKAYLFVDGRYIEYCQNNAKNVEIHLLAKGTLQSFLNEKKYKNVALEKDYLIYEDYLSIKNMLKLEEKNIQWINGQELRIYKSLDEVAKLQKAIDISLSAYEELMTKIKEGQNEKEVASLLNYIMKQKGAEKEGFDEIVAAGSSSAEPHHHPVENKKVQKGELLKIDYGAQYLGFTADITRTCIFGGEDKVNNPEALKILNIVKAAAKAGRDAVKPGIKASEIDKICRDYISKAGYEKFFLHGTGHGLGIDVHELPYVRSTSDYILEPGMVITVEPGIYIEGLGGARIEDDVLVVKQGRYVFSRKDERDPLEV
ncbi:M24 family metallopeptidase [Mycoplasmopsis lipophila]|uniref:M24 family metallopeptidase n=1 Tax=Mycoplasmopsis lipophila TaxID=2117 RepID=UPI0038730A21